MKTNYAHTHTFTKSDTSIHKRTTYVIGNSASTNKICGFLAIKENQKEANAMKTHVIYLFSNVGFNNQPVACFALENLSVR